MSLKIPKTAWVNLLWQFEDKNMDERYVESISATVLIFRIHVNWSKMISSYLRQKLLR